MAELLASKVVVVEEPPTIRGVPTLSTSSTGAVGLAERGPIGVATLVTSFEEYASVFGGFGDGLDLPLAAAGFFENGGRQLWVVRTCHYTDPFDAASATAAAASATLLVPGGGPTPARVVGGVAPFNVPNGAVLTLAVNGGAPIEADLNCTAATLESADEPFALWDGAALQLTINGTTMMLAVSAADFADVDAATADEVAAVLDTAMQPLGGEAEATAGKVVLRSKRLGHGSTLAAPGSAVGDALGLPAGPVQGTGPVFDIAAVTIEELAEGFEDDLDVSADTEGRLVMATKTSGPSSSISITASTFATALGLPTGVVHGAVGAPVPVTVHARERGRFANRYAVGLSPSTPPAPGVFDFGVVRIDDGVLLERFERASFDRASPRYIRALVNHPRSGSRLVAMPESGPDFTATVATDIGGPLTGGTDGVAGLVDQDFIGTEAAATGLHALNAVADLSLVLVPGRATAAVHNAMLAYCEHLRSGEAFAILDPPAGQSATGIVGYVATAALEGVSEFGALYWPRVKVLSPSTAAFGDAQTIVAPPSGAIAGVFARADAARPGGVYDPPAGIETGRLLGVVGFETDEVLDERKRDVVYPRRINPLTTGPGLPRFVDGSRTLKATGNFPYVAERRGVSFIARSLRQGLQFARHRNNTEALRAEVRRTVTAFLLQQMRDGAFRSTDPATAFFVDVSDALNPPSEVMAGRLHVRVGLATNKPAEFIILRIAADTRALDAELAGSR